MMLQIIATVIVFTSVGVATLCIYAILRYSWIIDTTNVIKRRFTNCRNRLLDLRKDFDWTHVNSGGIKATYTIYNLTYSTTQLMFRFWVWSEYGVVKYKTLYDYINFVNSLTDDEAKEILKPSTLKDAKKPEVNYVLHKNSWIEPSLENPWIEPSLGTPYATTSQTGSFEDFKAAYNSTRESSTATITQ